MREHYLHIWARSWCAVARARTSDSVGRLWLVVRCTAKAGRIWRPRLTVDGSYTSKWYQDIRRKLNLLSTEFLLFKSSYSFRLQSLINDQEPPKSMLPCLKRSTTLSQFKENTNENPRRSSFNPPNCLNPQDLDKRG